MPFHDFSLKLLKFMTSQVLDADSGLFWFIHDCGNAGKPI